MNKACGLAAALFLGGLSASHAQTPTIQWEKTYGGSKFDGVNYIQQTSDGGYICGAYTNSSDSDVTGAHGGVDCWAVKIDALGAIQWQHTYGGSGDDQIDQIKEDVNGGYIISGYTASDDGDVDTTFGGGDAWVIKLR